jgi:hypothetical protein
MGVYDMPNAGTYATKGTNFIGTGNQNPYTLIFTFTKPILSFGLAITDFADIIPSTISVQVQSGASTTVLTGPSTATKLADGNLLFFGLTTTDMPMTEIRLISNSSDPIGIDAVQYSFAPVPEAGGLIIWSVLGLCVGIKAWHRRPIPPRCH